MTGHFIRQSPNVPLIFDSLVYCKMFVKSTSLKEHVLSQHKIVELEYVIDDKHPARRHLQAQPSGILLVGACRLTVMQRAGRYE